jgi:hypothetical protein
MERGKVAPDPARQVRMRSESDGRLRFLSRDEYLRLSEIIFHDSPEQRSAFVVSVSTEMLWGKQFSLNWSQVDMGRKIIGLTQTKNRCARNVHLNSVGPEALQH